MLAKRRCMKPCCVEFPVLVAVGAEPLAGVVVPFIGKAHGDAIVGEGPQFLDQPVVQFPCPFARQELVDLRRGPTGNSARLRQRVSGV